MRKRYFVVWVSITITIVQDSLKKVYWRVPVRVGSL